MEAKKFLSELKRMCLTYEECFWCDLYDRQCPINGENFEENIEPIVAAVEEWSQQHPLPKFTRIEAD